MEMESTVIDEKNMEKLNALGNKRALEIVKKYVDLCKPGKVTVIDDSKEMVEYIRQLSLKNKEEQPLGTEGHTIHFDGFHDQGRDKTNTKVLIPKGEKLSKSINTGDRDECLQEVEQLLDGIMEGREMLVLFFCLGPIDSKFSISALQITDSAYVGHGETILFRPGYEQFKKLNGSDDFFYFVHSSGELENAVSKNVDKRRIYIDLRGKRVYTINNQYAGNSVGLKKLALRLAIQRSHEEEWLCEHMFIMGVQNPVKNRTTYITGAFPSASGKTSTAMLPGQTIIGDDIAYLKHGKDNNTFAVNVEQGIFGIIEDVNTVDDPLIYKALTTPREVIFSNVLINDGKPYWLGMGEDAPKEGINFSGEWYEGKKDSNGKEILYAHKNARYFINIGELENADPKLHDPEGVPVEGIIYGARDSDTNPPVLQSFNWKHGVFVGAALESETTAAILGEAGRRVHDPMANMDFLVLPLGTYIKNHLQFGERTSKQPLIFTTNYFLKEEGKFLNDKVDKKVWIMWIEGRIHNEYKAIETPIGYIPMYEDVKDLFREIFQKEYKKEDYEKQFSIRVNKLLKRLDRVEAIYKEEENIPEEFSNNLQKQRERLLEAREKFGKDSVSPFSFL